MPVVRIISPREITWDIYNQVQARLEAEGPPEGLIVHTAVDHDGRPKFIGIWESGDHADRFGRERLGPIIAEIAPDVAGPPEPDQIEQYEVKTLMRG